MYGIAIVNGYSGIGSKQAGRLKEEFSRYDAELDIFPNAVCAEYPASDFVVFLDKDVRLAAEFEKKGVRVFNSSETIRICEDKTLTYLAVGGEGVVVPCTVYAPLCYSDLSKMRKKVSEEADKVIQTLGLPLIFKLNVGSLGIGTRLIESREELEAAMTEFSAVPHHYQRFVSSSVGRDVRIAVIGGKAVASMRRRNERGFLSNIAAGGVAEKFVPDERFFRMAEIAASRVRADYCGVDLLEDERGEPVLLEVNSNAYFEGIERVSGVNVAGKFAEYILGAVGSGKV